MKHCSRLNKFLLVLIAVCCVTVLSSPTSKDEIHQIYTGSKRDASTANPALTSALIKSALFNPYMYPLFPGKPYFYPLLTPPEVLLNRFVKSTLADGKSAPQIPSQTPEEASGVGTGEGKGNSFAARKKEIVEKLLERVNETGDSSQLSARSVTPSPENPDGATKPTLDPSFFIKKKFDFLDKLMKTFNLTAETEAVTGETTSAPTPKPTIVPPGFWFPIIKPPKPPKAPKPTKPPKTKKILKDALDAAILQSFLADLGIDPFNGTTGKRAVGTAFGAKKAKSKKVKPEEEPSAFYIPDKIDPILYSTKASDCLDKLFKILSKTDAEDVSNFIEPKATVIPNNLLNEPSETEYTSKLDAFLDLLIKSLNNTGGSEAPAGKPFKSKKPTGLSKIIKKRSTFLDELLHRIPPSPPPTEPEPTSSNCECSTKVPCCCGDCGATDKSTRSLAFKPFGTGYWIPQYLYATKMSLYLDKLMDTINTAAAEDVSVDASSTKRSLASQTSKVNVTGANTREAALSLIIAELVDLKNDIVDAFEDGIKAQKTASTTKPYSPVGKSFKKPFWGGKTSPTPDPIEPIQKRIDILNGIFDNITEIEKTLLFGDDMENGNTESSDSNGSLMKIDYKLGKSKETKSETSPISDDEIEKLKGLLKSLYADKMSALNDGYK